MSRVFYRLRSVAFATVFLLATASAGAQYRWTDSTGRVNYGDAPPSDAKNVSRMGGRTRGETGDPTGGMPFELRKAIETFPVTLYTALECAPCETARAYLRQRSVPFQEVVVETDVDAEELKRRVGTTAVPVMTLGRTPHAGFREAAWSLALSSAGYPAQIVLPPTYRAAPPQTILPPDAPKNTAPAEAPVPRN